MVVTKRNIQNPCFGDGKGETFITATGGSPP
jgi:hypothetical protein